jgi:hypothetical protein
MVGERRDGPGLDRMEDLLDRLRREPAFVAALAADPAAILAGYDLSADDLDRLAELLRGAGNVPEQVKHFADLFEPD